MSGSPEVGTGVQSSVPSTCRLLRSAADYNYYAWKNTWMEIVLYQILCRREDMSTDSRKVEESSHPAAFTTAAKGDMGVQGETGQCRTGRELGCTTSLRCPSSIPHCEGNSSSSAAWEGKPAHRARRGIEGTGSAAAFGRRQDTRHVACHFLPVS